LQIPAQFVAIRLVTILEVFTRDWVAELVDSGDPYTSRGAELVKGSLKIDYAMAQALVGKQVTFGELVSHEIPVNDIGDIDRAFSTLLDVSLFASLEGIVDRWAIRVDDNPVAPILPDSAWARAQISRLFAARHIVVHELPDEENFELANIADFARATNQFVEAADQHFDRLLHGEYPATQQGMNAAAAERASEADAELRTLIALLDPDMSDARLIAAQAAWEDYRQKQAEYRAGHHEGGSIAPMLYAEELENVTRARIDRLRWFLEREEGDM
jgi:uncharacterized protein YecT (DUF1311 family)